MRQRANAYPGRPGQWWWWWWRPAGREAQGRGRRLAAAAQRGTTKLLPGCRICRAAAIFGASWHPLGKATRSTRPGPDVLSRVRPLFWPSHGRICLPPPRLLVKTKGKHACRARRLLRRRPAPACPWPCQCPAKGIRIHNPALYAPLGQTLQLKLGQPVVPRVDCATHVIPWFRKDSSPPKVQTSAVQTGVSEAAVQRAPPMLPQHLYTPGTSCANTTRAARREPALLEQHTARPAPDNRLSTASAQESSSVHAPARVRCCHSSKRHSASHPSKCPVHLASTHTTVAFVPELKPY